MTETMIMATTLIESDKFYIVHCFQMYISLHICWTSQTKKAYVEARFHHDNNAIVSIVMKTL